MPTRSSIAVDEARILGLIDAWGKALRAKDINGIMSHYAVDIVTFGLAPPQSGG
jgi:ketosteroid isomerase-like protein